MNSLFKLKFKMHKLVNIIFYLIIFLVGFLVGLTINSVSAEELDTKNSSVVCRVSKNLFDITKYSSSTSQGYPLKDYLQVGKTYTISFKNTNTTYLFLSKVDAWGLMEDDMLFVYSMTSFSFVYTQAMYDKGYMLYILNPDDDMPLSIDTIQSLKLQIEEGDIPSHYEPYGKQTCEIIISDDNMFYYISKNIIGTLDFKDFWVYDLVACFLAISGISIIVVVVLSIFKFFVRG